MSKKQWGNLFFFPIRLMIVVPLVFISTLLFLISFFILQGAYKDYLQSLDSLRIFLISGKDQYS
jgi:hypothetical protein